MRLDHYLAANDISYRAFAKQIGTPHATTVQRYAKFKRRPSAQMMAAIEFATGGAVRASDFFEADATTTAAAAAEA